MDRRPSIGGTLSGLLDRLRDLCKVYIVGNISRVHELNRLSMPRRKK